METKESAKAFEQAKNYFPGGVNSPVRAFKSVGGTPRFIQSGKGSHLIDLDGNVYLDFCCSWGPLIHGHAHPKVVEAAINTVKKGSSFGAPTEEENLLASLIISHNPTVELLRFLSSGTEAVMSAIRAARGYTKRNLIIKFEGCYHGHLDAMLVKAGSGLITFGNSSSAGVPEGITNDTLTLPLDNESILEEAFSRFGNQIAVVVVEPIPANNGLLIQRKEFLEKLRMLTLAHGSVLLFDEVISGFRVGFGGAAGLYAIKPDLVTYGKVIGGGFPVGAYGGKKEIMAMISPDGPVYQGGTLSGNPVAMAAGFAQLSLCLQEGFYEMMELKTKRLIQCIAEASGLDPDLHTPSVGSIFWISMGEKKHPIRNADAIETLSVNRFNYMYHRLLNKGIYLGPSAYEVGFVSSAHTEDDLVKAGKIIGEEMRRAKAEIN